MRPSDESLRIMWPFCGFKMATPDTYYKITDFIKQKQRFNLRIKYLFVDTLI
jgi:hypothetical protein